MTVLEQAQLAIPWTPDRSAECYRLAEWSGGFFGASPRGTVEVYPDANADRTIDLLDVVEGLKARDICPPVVIRFSGILAHRMSELRRAFDIAIENARYGGKYTCVYPIKVNQQRHICEEIRDIGGALGFGLEVGSKPELLAALALTEGSNRMPVVCNGFKDEVYIETVILAAKMGRNVIPVVEQAHELDLIADFAQAHDVTPQIGIRAKLATNGMGRWSESGGIRGKFGLSLTEILAAVERLRQRGFLQSLRMLHCHIGSQVTDLTAISSAVNEVTRLYVELVRLGASMGMLDVGGGLGVDYDGTRGTTPSSINYCLDRYAETVVSRIKTVCDGARVAHPDVITESGRALVAHSSVLVCEALGSRVFPREPDAELLRRALAGPRVPRPLRAMSTAHRNIEHADPVEVYTEATRALGEVERLFNLGWTDITSRAAAESLYWAIANGLIERHGDDLPEELAALPDHVSDIYFCNFSLFQSLPDSWSIGQIFPIMPIHRLEEEPTRRATLVDITCDSDGRIDQFAGPAGPKARLELHPLHAPGDGPQPTGGDTEPYYLGVFLSAAYQEILGDLHNLFGDTHAVHVSLGCDGRWCVDEVVEGDAVRDVLRYVQFDPEHMRRTLRLDIERAHAAGRLTLPEAASLKRFLDRGFEGYTYLNG